MHDDEGVGDSLRMEQKVALRALLTALLGALPASEEGAGVGDASGEPVHVRLNSIGARRSVFVRMPYAGSEAGARREFGACIAVMNAVFGRSTVTVEEGELRLVFAWEPESTAVAVSNPGPTPSAASVSPVGNAGRPRP